jgi:hypothetical protein
MQKSLKVTFCKKKSPYYFRSNIITFSVFFQQKVETLIG